ncbi:MAG: hypothetical protein B0W54_21670 [Cellvibrio sp. 79]|nr:MAG: hypothetical protein B0W54_21670 [Cellvibrio sp. 79]
MNNSRHASATVWMLRIFWLTLAYVIAGRLSLLLAIPPGFVTGLFLPMGISLGAVLIWGAPMLWGVFLGSTLLNISVSLSSGQSLSLPLVMVAMEIAAGSSIASLAGAGLIRHYIGFPDKLTDERKIFAFFILGGPIATSLSASCGALVLYINGIIHYSQVLFTWWTWWIGDAIGVLIATPLMCVFFATPRHFWSNRRYTVGVPMVVSSLVVVTVFVLASNNEQRKLENHFGQQAELITASIETNLTSLAYSLATLRGLFIASDQVTRSEFAAYIKNVIPGIKGVKGVSWNKHIRQEDRVAFEQEMREQGYENFQIREKTATDTYQPAPQRSEYTVITYVEPAQENLALVGIEVGAEPIRAAAQIRARDTGNLAMTAPLHLLNDPRSTRGIIVFYPVYKGIDNLTTAAERQQALEGYATAIVRINELIPPALSGFTASDFEIHITDITDTANPVIFFTSHQEASSTYAQTLEVKTELLFGGRHLLVSVIPSETFLLEHRSLQSWFVLAGGLLFCSFLGGFLLLITGRTQHVRDLVDQRTKELAAILEHAMESILIVDEYGQITKSNPAATQLFGYKFDSLLNLTLGDLIPSLRKLFEVNSEDLKSISWRESVGVRSDGSELPIELSMSPVELQEQKFFTIMVHDATAKRKVDRLKNEFISTVSHELRTPLTSIKGALGIALSGDLGALELRTRDLLVIANNNADRLTRLVNDILDIDKLEFGNVQLNNQRIAIYPLLKQSVEQNQGHSARYGVELILDTIDSSLHELPASLDADRFLQVMSNLLSNAIKYSHLGGKVSVNLERDGRYFKISVIDEGQGIPPDFRQRVFSKFAQVDSSDTKRRDGTGLGLSITKAIVERFGGKIDYHSVEGEGTTFFFTIPILE